MAEEAKVELTEKAQEEVVVETKAPEADKPIVEAKEPAKVAEEPKEELKPVERPLYSMPVAKAQKEKERAVEKAKQEAKEEMDREIKKVKEEYEGKLRTAQPDDYTQKLSEVAEKHGLNADAARDLADAIRGSIQLPDTTKYDAILKEKEIEGHKTAVSKEFDDVVAPLLLKDFPASTPEHIREVKAKIQELAFTQGYNTYRLEDIYAIKKSDFSFKNGMTAEAPKGHGTVIEGFKELSDEDEIALADREPATYARYLKWLSGKQSKYLN